jgi:hypothetical protein
VAPKTNHSFQLTTGIVDATPSALTATRPLTGAMTTNSICLECNNQWMSQIENRAPRALKRMVDALPTMLNVADQRCIATWMAPKIYVLDHTQPTASILPATDIQSLRTIQSSPPGFRLWAANIIQTPGVHGQHSLERFHHNGQGDSGATDNPEAALLLLAVGSPADSVLVTAVFSTFSSALSAVTLRRFSRMPATSSAASAAPIALSRRSPASSTRYASSSEKVSL